MGAAGKLRTWLTGWWQTVPLHQRLAVSYGWLVGVLLLLVATMVLPLMRQVLHRALEEDLGEVHAQFSSRASVLNLSSRRGANLYDVRRVFPSSIVQIDPLMWPGRDGELAKHWPEIESGHVTAEGLRLLLQESSRFRPLPVGIDPAASVSLSEFELQRLLRSPDRRMFITRTVREQFGQPQEARFLVTLTPLWMNDASGQTRHTAAIVYIGRSLESVNATLGNLRMIMLQLWLCGVLLTVIFSRIFAEWSLRPLVSLRRSVGGVDSKHLSVRLPLPAAKDEIQDLAQTFNRMLDDMERSFELQKRFASDASHELRTPATVIKGHADYLMRHTDLSPQQRESVESIRAQVDRMSDLTTKLLQLARSDSGSMSLNLQPIFSSDLLSEKSKELKEFAARHGAEVVALPSACVFEADEGALHQVLNNLIVNALKAGAKRVELSCEHQSDISVCLCVADNGSGIGEEDLRHIFERFYRPEDSRNRDLGGAGLGLSITKGLVQAHGGRIWLDSELGKGTRFFVELPVGDVPDLDAEDVP